MVECQPSKLNVEGSNPFVRFVSGPFESWQSWLDVNRLHAMTTFKIACFRQTRLCTLCVLARSIDTSLGLRLWGPACVVADVPETAESTAST